LDLAKRGEALNDSVEQMNEVRSEWNERVGKILSECTGEPVSSDPKDWWNWWSTYANVASPSQRVLWSSTNDNRLQPFQRFEGVA